MAAIKRTTTGIKLNDEERQQLRARADQHGVSIGKLLKHAAVHEPIEVVHVVDDPDRRMLIRQIVRIGCNLNQVAEAMNRIAKNGGGSSNFQAWAGAVLDDVRADLKKLAS